MEPKFVSFEDVIEKLGISAERLHALREEGSLRAYRDAKSWKFRTDEIESMVESGVPDAPPPSDIGLVSPGDLVEATPIDGPDDDDDDLGLALIDEDALDLDEGKAAPPTAEKSDPDLDLDLDDTDAVPGGSAIDLEGLDDTVTAGTSDIELDLELPEGGPSDSILLSEEALGMSVSGSPSTIIGKDKLDSEDADLELAMDDEVTTEGSDVKLASSAGASDVLSSSIAGSGVLDELEDSTGGTSAFKDLEEIDDKIDLAAESSPALTPGEVAAPGEVAGEKPAASDSEVALDDLQLADDDSNMGSTDVPMLEIETDGDGGGSGSEIELAGDDDLILADSSGSDLSLDSGDSGINLISPADSGLALDDIPLEMGGSAILSSLSLEGSDPEISLIGGDSVIGEGVIGEGVIGEGDDEPMAELQTDDDFQLTPLSEGGEVEGDSSSQVIALDAGIDDFSDGAAVLEIFLSQLRKWEVRRATS